ncbi:MAG: 6,7-dimethyl-8-ribityllumazine synthase [Legionellales bacterium]|nr:6,7-dimethyl-8-ribityllumazine synthase [Legionellales bacterium]
MLGPNQLKPFPIALIVSRFNQSITDRLLQGAMLRLQQLNFPDEHVTVIEVPGAVEIPLIAKRLAQRQTFAAIVTLGAVIRGETSHYDYVCEQVSQGCQRVSLDYDVPVIFGVLTTDDVEQARARVGGAHGHKGREAIDAAVEMVSLLQQLS